MKYKLKVIDPDDSLVNVCLDHFDRYLGVKFPKDLDKMKKKGDQALQFTLPGALSEIQILLERVSNDEPIYWFVHRLIIYDNPKNQVSNHYSARFILNTVS